MFTRVLLATTLTVVPLAVSVAPAQAYDSDKIAVSSGLSKAEEKKEAKEAKEAKAEAKAEAKEQAQEVKAEAKQDAKNAVNQNEVVSAAEPAKEVEKANKPVIKNGKVEATKNQVQHAKAKQVKTDRAMIDAANQIDGVKIDPKTFEEKKKFTVGSLNPIKWIFKPIIDMQKEVMHLEKQIMRLEAPIAGLQKPMIGLRSDMVSVQEEMNVMHADITDIHGGMKGVDKRLAHIELQLNQMYEPVADLKNPVIALEKPVNGVSKQLNTLKADLKELKDVVSLTTKLILAAVVGVGLLIVVGTPVAALFAWRHRRTIMEKLGDDTKGKAEPTDESPSEKREAAANK